VNPRNLEMRKQFKMLCEAKVPLQRIAAELRISLGRVYQLKNDLRRRPGAFLDCPARHHAKKVAEIRRVIDDLLGTPRYQGGRWAVSELLEDIQTKTGQPYDEQRLRMTLNRMGYKLRWIRDRDYFSASKRSLKAKVAE